MTPKLHAPYIEVVYPWVINTSSPLVDRTIKLLVTSQNRIIWEH